MCMYLRTDWLLNNYVRNSLSIFTKFCMQLGNVVGLTSIVYETHHW